MQINTICRDCIFAIREGGEQTDCRFDRLSKFEKQGATVTGQDDYLVIKGRFCNACRNEEWGKQYRREDWESIVKREFAIQCHFLIYADANLTVEDVKTSLDTVINQEEVPPKSVTLIVSRPDNDAGEYVLMFRTMDVPFKWRVQKVVNNEKYNFNYRSSIDFALENVKDGNYYTVAHAGYKWPLDYLKVIEGAINYDMVRVLALHPENDQEDGLFVDIGTHKSLNGNGFFPIVSDKYEPILHKIQKISELKNYPNMVYRWGSLKIYESHRDHIVL